MEQEFKFIEQKINELNKSDDYSNTNLKNIKNYLTCLKIILDKKISVGFLLTVCFSSLLRTDKEALNLFNNCVTKECKLTLDEFKFLRTYLQQYR